MSARNLIIRLEADDKLTPALKQSKKELQQLLSEINAMQNQLTTLRANKALIKSGDFDTGIQSISKLQAELKNLQSTSASLNQIRHKQAQISSEVAKAELKLKNAISQHQNKADLLALTTQKAIKAHTDESKAIQQNQAVRNSATNSLVRHIRQAETLIISLYGIKKAYDVLLGSGVGLNRQIESQVAGIAALITANTKLADGSSDLKKQFSLSLNLSENIVKELKKASVETAATFGELTAIFQQAIGGALGAGKAMGESLDAQVNNTINLAKRMSNIASAIGMPMVQVNEEIRSIIEGTIDVNSRIAKMLGITNEQIRNAKKEVGGLVKLFDKVLKPFDELAGLQTFDKAIARLKDSIDSIKIDATQPIFSALKVELDEINRLVIKNKDEITKFVSSAGKFIGADLVNAVKHFATAIAGAKDELLLIGKAYATFWAVTKTARLFQTAITGVMGLGTAFGTLSKEIKGATGLLSKFSIALGAVGKSAGWLGVILGGGTLLYELYKSLTDSTTASEALSDALGKTKDELNKLSQAERDYMGLKLTDALKAKQDELEKIQKKLELANKGGYTSMRSGTTYGTLNEAERLKLEADKGALEREINEIKQRALELKDVSTNIAEKKEKLLSEAKLQLEAISKLSDDEQKLLQKYGKGIVDGTQQSVAKIQASLTKFKALLANVSKNGLNEAELKNVIKGLNKELVEIQTKAQDDIVRMAKQKADEQIRIYRQIGETQKANALELKKLQAELDEQIKKGIITQEQAETALHLKRMQNLQEAIKKQQEYYRAIGDKNGENRTQEQMDILSARMNFSDPTQQENVIRHVQEKYTQEQELKYKKEYYEIRRMEIELIDDEREKKDALIELEREIRLEDLEFRYRRGELDEMYYNRLKDLTNKYYNMQKFKNSKIYDLMMAGISALERGMERFFDYTSDRFLKFKDLANSVLHAIYQQIIKLYMIQPITKGITSAIGAFASGFFGGGGETAASMSTVDTPNYGYAHAYAAKGDVFNSPSLRAYENSIVSRPTAFYFAKGGVPNIGIMGEKGGGSPEAIMPLSRTSSGDLGVKVVREESQLSNLKIEVVNQSKEEVKATNVNSRNNLGEQVITIVLDAIRTNKMGMREAIGGA